MIQRLLDPEAEAMDPTSAARTLQSVVAGGERLPHRRELRRAFGRHDLTE